MKKPSRLHRKLPDWAKPFCSIQIGSKSYDDESIISVKISYGSGSSSVTVPTATIEIFGNLAVAYNSDVTISFQISGGNRATRFIGRVGEQSIRDSGKSRITTIIATSKSIGLFRSNVKMNMRAGSAISDMVYAMNQEVSRKGISNVTIGRTATLWDDKTHEAKEMSAKDVVSFAEKHGVVINHFRSGEVRFQHPEDRKNELVRVAGTIPPILRSQVLAPAEYRQPNAYIDNSYSVQVRYAGESEVYTADFTDLYLEEISTKPVDKEVLDLTDLGYSKDTRYWRYPLRKATFEKMWLSYRIDSLEVDLLALMTGGYNTDIFNYLTSLNEGEMLSLGGDWDKYLQGAKVVSGYEETLTHQGYRMSLTLIDPRIYFGFNGWTDPLPELPIYVWDQAGSMRWDENTRTWEETN